MGQPLIGSKVLRKEDLRLVTGEGCYADECFRGTARVWLFHPITSCTCAHPGRP